MSTRLCPEGLLPAYPQKSAISLLLVSYLATLILGSASGEYAFRGIENLANRRLDVNENCPGGKCGEGDESVSSAMWFGPRLGRRRRSDGKYGTFGEEEINSIANALQGPPWTLVSIQGDKRHSKQFTPRLGRESGEDLWQKLLMGENTEYGHVVDNEIVEERELTTAPPYSRISRYQLTPPPRLGRRINELFQKR